MRGGIGIPTRKLNLGEMEHVGRGLPLVCYKWRRQGLNPNFGAL